MSTFAEDILWTADGEEIIAITVSPNRKGYNKTPDHTLGTGLVSWEEAFPVLHYTYDAGFGNRDCHDITAWTPTRVLYIHEYGGSTTVASIFRDPTPCR